jgi:hypothetical protein
MYGLHGTIRLSSWSVSEGEVKSAKVGVTVETKDAVRSDLTSCIVGVAPESLFFDATVEAT